MLTLHQLPERFAVCRLESTETIPDWIDDEGFVSITRTSRELSIVCDESRIPPDCMAERNWRCLIVGGALPFDAVGVLASLAKPLAERGISIFVISTYDTDHILVKDDDLERAIDALTACGHTVLTAAQDV